MKFLETFDPTSNAPVQVWEEPLTGHGYVIGADVAEGLEHGDFSDAAVLDCDTGLLVAKWHGHADVDVFGDELALLGHWYNTALIGVEANNMGIATLRALLRRKYPRVFRRRTIGQVSEKFSPQWGWLTNKVTKPQMITELGAALRDGTIDVRDESTLAELRTYIRDYTAAGNAQMHGSPHDDRVMSLAIAVQMLAYATTFEAQAEKRDQAGTFDWWLQQARNAEAVQDEVQPIGHTGGTRVPGVAGPTFRAG